MKVHIINLAERGLRTIGKNLSESKIAVMGLAYKKNINDTRESPSINIIEKLVNAGADVRVFDPFVPSIITRARVYYSANGIEQVLLEADCAMSLIDHDSFKDISLDVMKELMSHPSYC